jgi:hypothetical protein
MGPHAFVAMPLPPASKLILTDPERDRLQAISRHRSTPRGIALRINTLLGAAEGVANHVLARNLFTSLPTVLLCSLSDFAMPVGILH